MTPRKLSNASVTSAASSPGAAVVVASTATAVVNPTLSKHMPQLASVPSAVNPHLSTIKKNPAALPLGRGVPPPIPPNKPVVPPKREPSATRLGLVTTASKENVAMPAVAGIVSPLATGASVATSGHANTFGSTKDDGGCGSSDTGCSADDLKDFQQAISSISNK